MISFFFRWMQFRVPHCEFQTIRSVETKSNCMWQHDQPIKGRSKFQQILSNLRETHCKFVSWLPQTPHQKFQYIRHKLTVWEYGKDSLVALTWLQNVTFSQTSGVGWSLIGLDLFPRDPCVKMNHTWVGWQLPMESDVLEILYICVSYGAEFSNLDEQAVSERNTNLM